MAIREFKCKKCNEIFRKDSPNCINGASHEKFIYRGAKRLQVLEDGSEVEVEKHVSILATCPKCGETCQQILSLNVTWSDNLIPYGGTPGSDNGYRVVYDRHQRGPQYDSVKNKKVANETTRMMRTDAEKTKQQILAASED